jgi:hypothetical protein
LLSAYFASCSWNPNTELTYLLNFPLVDSYLACCYFLPSAGSSPTACPGSSHLTMSLFNLILTNIK